LFEETEIVVDCRRRRHRRSRRVERQSSVSGNRCNSTSQLTAAT